MLYEILVPFTDKDTGQLYEFGSRVEFTDERAEEIKTIQEEEYADLGAFIKLVEEKKPTKKSIKKKGADD